MRTRSSLDDLLEGSNENNPPLPPTMAEVLMRIEQNRQMNQALLEALVRNTAPQGGGGAGRRDDFLDFLRTQPLTFTRAEDPLDADHWLRTIEQKLALLRRKDHERALFATHQLQGPAGAWWSNYLAMHPANYRVLGGVPPSIPRFPHSQRSYGDQAMGVHGPQAGRPIGDEICAGVQPPCTIYSR